ncbi:CopG family ribbon-helix-helix protein [Acidicapsa acidisoli]|uniref:CopG family ribbon-helix-helix protein n=1 Tax=Acidicapsa acidisoli TaxID=1615681 RepID=UPI0021E0E773|nr:hypothetical protein [Acidicapsa acidisoli]
MAHLAYARLYMEIHLTEQQQNSLAVLSSQTRRSADDLVRDAVDRMLAHEKWFEEQVRIGIDQVARGEFLDEDEMDERVARMLHA